MDQGPAIPHQRRSEHAMRREAGRRCREAAIEAEAQDPGTSKTSWLWFLLARLFDAPPALVSDDMARVAAVLLGEPYPTESVTDEVVVQEAS